MGKYVHKFYSWEDFYEAYDGSGYTEPWLSCVEGESPSTAFNKFDPYNGHEYVNLGLPSRTVWATMNIGANSPEEAGYYYSWGETQTKSTYSWSTYKFGTASPFTKYDTDGKTELEYEDDIAAISMGGFWHMPAVEQLEELVEETNHEVTVLNGVSGITFSSKSNPSASIFVPYAGQRSGSRLYGFGTGFNLLSSSLVKTDSRLIYNLTSGLEINDTNGRCNGYTIRGVVGHPIMVVPNPPVVQ